MSQCVCIYNIGKVHIKNDWNYKISGSLFWRIYYIHEGNAHVRIYDDLHVLKPDHLYLIPAYTPHEDILKGSFTHTYLHFKLDDTALNNTLEQYELCFEIPANKLLVDALSAIQNICPGFELETSLPQAYEIKQSYIYWSQRYDNLPIHNRLEIAGLIRILLAAFIAGSNKRSPVKNPRAEKGRVFINNNFSDPISVNDVANHIGMRPESFIRVFKSEFHRTPFDYLLEKRLNKAKSLLMLSSLSVKEIASSCGFHDNSYFCATFRKATSLSPGAFRKSGGQ